MIVPIAAETRIANKLVDTKQLSRVELDGAQIESEIAGRSLVETLLIGDVLSEADAAQAMADFLGLRFVDLSRRKPSIAWALSLPENIARRCCALVFGEVSGQLVVAVADPFDPAVRSAIANRFDRAVQYVVSARYQIIQTQDEIYGEARRRGARMADALPVASATATVSDTGLNMVEQLDSVIDEAVDRRASDIHIESEKDRLRIRMRIDGRMIEARAYPLEAAPALISRVKVMATLDITERRKPQDGRFTHRSFEQEIDVRVACIPTVDGERITLRLLSLDRSALTLTSLGMELEI